MYTTLCCIQVCDLHEHKHAPTVQPLYIVCTSLVCEVYVQHTLRRLAFDTLDIHQLFTIVLHFAVIAKRCSTDTPNICEVNLRHQTGFYCIEKVLTVKKYSGKAVFEVYYLDVCIMLGCKQQRLHPQFTPTYHLIVQSLDAVTHIGRNPPSPYLKTENHPPASNTA